MALMYDHMLAGRWVLPAWGHFATYTEDAPLFGNFVGTVWKPQHVRGSAQRGAVVKDYHIRTPTDTP